MSLATTTERRQAAGFPSNRWNYREESFSQAEPQALIDTIKVAGTVQTPELVDVRLHQALDEGTGELVQRFSATRRSLSQSVLEVTRGWDGLVYGVFEISVPKVINGHNLKAAAIPQALEVVADLYEQASTYLQWTLPVEDLQVRRLDVVRDFRDVDHLDHLLHGLARLHVRGNTNPSVYSDNNRGGALTLTRKAPGFGRCSLYDKGQETLHQARRHPAPQEHKLWSQRAAQAQGQVRFEVQCRAPELRRLEIATISAITEEKLTGIRADSFHKARFDTPVGGRPHLDQVCRHLAVAGDPNYKFFWSVVGMLHANAHGLPQAGSPPTLRKYRTLAATWGISEADLGNVGGPAVALDFTSGRLAVS